MHSKHRAGTYCAFSVGKDCLRFCFKQKAEIKTNDKNCEMSVMERSSCIFGHGAAVNQGSITFSSSDCSQLLREVLLGGSFPACE